MMQEGPEALPKLVAASFAFLRERQRTPTVNCLEKNAYCDSKQPGSRLTHDERPAKFTWRFTNIEKLQPVLDFLQAW